jgi:hypothetical protein
LAAVAGFAAASIERVARKFPHINVVIISGRPPPYIPQEASFVLKPYRARELLEAVLV